MSSAVLLAPMMAVPESRIQTAEPGAVPQATAHVNFRIVIPKVLYLHLENKNAACTLSQPHAGRAPPGATQLVCTASMP